MAWKVDSNQSLLSVAAYGVTTVDGNAVAADFQGVMLALATSSTTAVSVSATNPLPVKQTHGKTIISGPIDFATAGNHTLVAGSGSLTVKVLAIFFVCTLANVIQLLDSAGTPLELTGPMSFSAQGGLMLPMTPDPNIGYFKPTGAGAGLVMNAGSAQQVSGGFVAVQE